jgi:hypothetical protein
VEIGGKGGKGGGARGEGYINVVISPDISAATCYYRCKYSLFNYMALVITSERDVIVHG